MEPIMPNNFLECPFSHTCNLPLYQHSCNFPEYKVCSEYQIKLKKLKSASKIIQ